MDQNMITLKVSFKVKSNFPLDCNKNLAQYCTSLSLSTLQVDALPLTTPHIFIKRGIDKELTCNQAFFFWGSAKVWQRKSRHFFLS